MTNLKTTLVPIRDFKFSLNQCPSSDEDNENMMNVPYSNVVGSIMYTMICIRLDVAYEISHLSHFRSNLGREHWEGIKWLLRYLKGSIDTSLMFKYCKEGVVLRGM